MIGRPRKRKKSRREKDRNGLLRKKPRNLLSNLFSPLPSVTTNFSQSRIVVEESLFIVSVS